MDLSLHLVRYLVAVIDEGHFGRAAAKLLVSGPALSKQIRTLERKLGVDLIDRSAHPVIPTDAGRQFLPDARAALAAADRAVAAIEAHRRTVHGVLRLGFMSAAAGTHIRRILDLLQQEAPAVTVQLVQLPWHEQATAVRDRSVDAALVRPPIVETDGLRLDLVRYEPRVVALPLTHRLATRATVVLADLDGEPHVTDDKSDEQWVRWWACDPRPSGEPVRYGPAVHTVDEILEVVASGEAISITGSSVIDSYRHPDVVFIPVVDIEPCPISLCTLDGEQSALVAALRRTVRAVRDASTTRHAPRLDPTPLTR